MEIYRERELEIYREELERVGDIQREGVEESWRFTERELKRVGDLQREGVEHSWRFTEIGS